MSEQLTATLKSFVDKLQSGYPEYRFDSGSKSNLGETVDKEGILFVTYPDGMEKQYMIPTALQGSVSVAIGAVERDIEAYERAQSITTQSNPAFSGPMVAPKKGTTTAMKPKEVTTTITKPRPTVEFKSPAPGVFLMQPVNFVDLVRALHMFYGHDESIIGVSIQGENIIMYNKEKIELK